MLLCRQWKQQVSERHGNRSVKPGFGGGWTSGSSSGSNGEQEGAVLTRQKPCAWPCWAQIGRDCHRGLVGTYCSYCLLSLVGARTWGAQAQFGTSQRSSLSCVSVIIRDSKVKPTWRIVDDEGGRPLGRVYLNVKSPVRQAHLVSHPVKSSSV